jgi:hypothetical protein
MKHFKLISISLFFFFSLNIGRAQEVLKSSKTEENSALKKADTTTKPKEQLINDTKPTWERSRNPNFKEPDPAVKKEEEKGITEKSKAPN